MTTSSKSESSLLPARQVFQCSVAVKRMQHRPSKLHIKDVTLESYLTNKCLSFLLRLSAIFAIMTLIYITNMASIWETNICCYIRILIAITTSCSTVQTITLYLPSIPTTGRNPSVGAALLIENRTIETYCDSFWSLSWVTFLTFWEIKVFTSLSSPLWLKLTEYIFFKLRCHA